MINPIKEHVYKFKEWQAKHRSNGYHVERLSGGQVRRYGPTVVKYIIICLDSYTHDEEKKAREYCVTEVEKADDLAKHSLLTHLIEFKRIGPRTYYYECGHDWTG